MAVSILVMCSVLWMKGSMWKILLRTICFHNTSLRDGWTPCSCIPYLVVEWWAAQKD